MRPVTNQTRPPDSQSAEAIVTSFKRSLKLLGFQPEEFRVGRDDDSSQRNQEKTKLKHVAPRLQTRVLERSVSLGDLRLALLHEAASLDTPREQMRLSRETLSKAVYEEWYFKKLNESQRKKELELSKEKQNAEDSDKAREAKTLRTVESLTKWKEMKLINQKKEENKRSKSSLAQHVQPVTKEQADIAYKQWKKKKELEMEQNKKVKLEQLKQQAVKDKALQDKKSDAIQDFDLWKKKAEQNLKAQKLKTEKKKNSEKVSKELRKKERTENSGISFQMWKIKKTQQSKENVLKVKLAKEEEEMRKKIRQSDRLYEAEQAFEEWLDAVEERKMARGRRSSAF